MWAASGVRQTGAYWGSSSCSLSYHHLSWLVTYLSSSMTSNITSGTIDFCRSHGFSFLPLPIGCKHPTQGWKKYQDTLPTEEEVESWRRIPHDMNVFIFTGELSNLVVVDLDKPKDSDESDDDFANRLIREYNLPPTYAVRTWGGWLHLYYLYPQWKVVKNSVKLLPHLDIRGRWWWVIAQWSVHESGKRYTVWYDNGGVFAEFPLSLLSLKSDKTDLVPLEKKTFSLQEGNKKGERNNATFLWLTDAIKKYKKWDYQGLREKLSAYNIQMNEEPLDEDELDAIYHSVTQFKESNELQKERTQLNNVFELLQSNGRLILDQIGDVYLVISKGTSQRCIPLESSDFKNWLQGEYYSKYRSIINSANLEGIKSILVCEASTSNKRYTLDIRLLKNGDAILYDLNDEQLSCVKIDTDGWSHCADNPGYFKRVKNTEEQVVPVPWWDINSLWKFINISDEDTRLLVLCTLVSLFVPEIQHPILMIHGGKWSAKSTFLRILKRIVDPSAKDLIGGLPSDLNGLVHTLLNDYILMFDNVSGISNDTSDHLCRAVSGAALSKRKLYTDSEDVIYRLRKCMCLNGINLEATQPDLLQRSIIVELDSISPESRLVESTLWKNFEQELPYILWALFSILSQAMSVYEAIDEKDYEFQRLADYNKWWEAICQSLGYEKGKFSALITANMEIHDEIATDSNVVTSALREFMMWRSEWEGTPNDLRELLHNIAAFKGVGKYIPSTPQSLMKTLNRYKVNLENLGIIFESKHSWNRRVLLKNNQPSLKSGMDPFG